MLRQRMPKSAADSVSTLSVVSSGTGGSAIMYVVPTFMNFVDGGLLLYCARRLLPYFTSNSLSD